MNLRNMLTLGVLLLSLPLLTSSFNLTILHINDFHARFEQTNKYSGSCSDKDAGAGKCFGGTARLVTKVNELRTQFPNSVFLSAGDEYSGTLWFYKYGGYVTSVFMNHLGYDVMALGNHEFDQEVSGLLPLLDRANFSIISSNIDTTQDPSLAGRIPGHVVLSVDGERIGVVGYTTTETPTISNPGQYLKFEDEITSIQREVDILTSLGVNKIIAVGHSGFNVDQKIAESVAGLDVVIGGHTNTFLYTGDHPSNEKPEGEYPHVVTQAGGAKVLVVQDYAYGKYLGFLQVIFNDQGVITAYDGNPILLDNNTAQDAETLMMMEPFREGVLAQSQEVVGKTMVHLEGSRFVCRVKECNLGNLITDAMIHQNLKHSDSMEWNHVAIAVVNSGGIRASLPKGDVTVGDLLTVQPFRNTVDIVELAGVHVKEMLEYTASRWVDGKDLFGGFLQVSGMKIVYDMNMPAFKRVIDVKVKCTECEVPELVPLEDEKVYKIIMPSFIANGGDGYAIIRDNKLRHHLIGDVDADVTIEYIKNFSPMTNGLEERIVLRQTPMCPCQNVFPTSRANTLTSVISLFALIVCIVWKKLIFGM